MALQIWRSSQRGEAENPRAAPVEAAQDGHESKGLRARLRAIWSRFAHWIGGASASPDSERVDDAAALESDDAETVGGSKAPLTSARLKDRPRRDAAMATAGGEPEKRRRSSSGGKTGDPKNAARRTDASRLESARADLLRKDALRKDAPRKDAPRKAEAPRRRPRTRAPALVPGKPRYASLYGAAEGVRLHGAERPAARRRPTAAAKRRAIVLVHGAGVDHRDWTFDFMERIDPDWRVVAFDRPGFGASERPNGAASALPTTQARLLRGAAQSLGIEDAILVGHSWGGAVVMAWGVEAPENVRGVASLAGAVAPWSLLNAIKNGRRVQAAARTALGPGGMRAAAIEAMNESFAPGAPPPGYFKHMATELNPMTGAAAATMADISTINGALALQAPRYAQMASPVELIYGDADAILSPQEQGEVAAATLPNARLTILPGVGHMVHHSRPSECVAGLERLIAAF